MDYVGSVSYVAQDKDWPKKIGMGALMALLSMVLVGAWALTGWAMEAFRRVVRGAEVKLPDWDDLGGYIGQGLKHTVVTLVWSLPMIVLAVLVFTIAGATAYTSSAVMTNSSVDVSLGASEAVFAGLGVLIWLVAFVYGLAVSFLGLGAFVIIAQTGDLGQALNPVNAWNVLSRDLGKWLVSGLMLLVGSFILSTIGSLLCGIGALVATPWIYAMMGNLLGQTFVETGSEL
jgi:hypothetical protein